MPFGPLALVEPTKPGIGDIIAQLPHLGVSLKIIPGDNHLVAANVSRPVGLAHARVLTGAKLRQRSDAALYRRLNAVSSL
jgi:P-type Mg2+ transporter